MDVKIIAIEEHWNSAGIRDALDRLPNGQVRAELPAEPQHGEIIA